MHILAFLMNIHVWTNCLFQGWLQYILELPCTPGDDHPPNDIHFWNTCVCVCVRARVCVCVCVHVLIHFSHVLLFATPWTVAPRLLCPQDFPEKILEQVAISSSRGSSWLRDWTCIPYSSWSGRWVLYH